MSEQRDEHDGRSSTSEDVEQANHEIHPGDRSATEASRQQGDDLERHGG